MKESHNEGVASHIGPESCLDDPRGSGEALTGGNTGGLLSSENTKSWRQIPWSEGEGETVYCVMRAVDRSSGVLEPGMCGHSPRENRDTSGRSLDGR